MVYLYIPILLLYLIKQNVVYYTHSPVHTERAFWILFHSRLFSFFPPAAEYFTVWMYISEFI